MPLGTTIDELIQRIDPLSYWSFVSLCQITSDGHLCLNRSIGYVSIGSGLCRVDVCNKHAKELTFTVMTSSYDPQAPQGSLLHVAANLDSRSFFSYTGKCEVIRQNMQTCGSEVVGYFTTIDNQQVKACHACTCKILYTLSQEQPELWLNPNARNQSVIIKMLKKWSTYDRIVQFAPSLC